MSKIYYSQGNGFFYSNIKDVEAIPSIKNELKKVVVYNPSTKQEEEKNRYETKFINGKLKYVSIFESKYAKSGEHLSITIEDKNGVEHIVQVEPYWTAVDTKSGSDFFYIVNSYFKSVASVIDQLEMGSEITLAINNKYTQKNKDGSDRLDRNGNPIFYESVSFLYKDEDGTIKAYKSEVAPKFEWSKKEEEGFKGKKKIIYDGQEELSYYYNKVTEFIESNKDGGGSTPEAHGGEELQTKLDDALPF